MKSDGNSGYKLGIDIKNLRQVSKGGVCEVCSCLDMWCCGDCWAFGARVGSEAPRRHSSK